MVSVSPIYAGILTLLFVALSGRVIASRRFLHVEFGDGNNKTLLRRMRAHANFAEYAPLGLLLMTLIELQDASKAAVHVVGILLLLGRGIHAYGVSREPELSSFRVAGMACTLSALLAGALINVVLALV